MSDERKNPSENKGAAKLTDQDMGEVSGGADGFETEENGFYIRRFCIDFSDSNQVIYGNIFILHMLC